MKKKLLAIVMAVVALVTMAIGLTACNGTQTPEPEKVTEYITNQVSITMKQDCVEVKSIQEDKTLAQVLLDNKDVLDLDSYDSEWGLTINNIGGIITDSTMTVKRDTSWVIGTPYVSVLINGDYAETGVSAINIDKDVTYKFVVDVYNEVAELKVHNPGEENPTFATIWGAKQSSEFHSYNLTITRTLSGEYGEQKVEDVLNKFGFEIEVSGTGYLAFKFNGVRESQSEKPDKGKTAFVPTVYSTKDGKISGYAKGVHPVKSSVEMAKVAEGAPALYVLAIEWDGVTQATEVNFL